MPVSRFKHLKRSKKYYNKRALIFKMNPDHERQYKHRKRKSVIYQNTVFNQFGSELGFINYTLALIRTIDEFNERYEDSMFNSRHGVLLLLIKQYATANYDKPFKAADIYGYYPNIHMFFGPFHDNSHKAFQVLFVDLMHLGYISPQGYAYLPTMRLKHFCNRYEHHCKELFKEPDK